MPETRETRSLPAEFRIRRSDDGVVTIEGYAAVFNSLSDELWPGMREKIAPGAFAKALGRSDVRALINHDPNLILGRTTPKTLRLRENDKGLWMEVDLPATSYASDLAVSIERGDITQQSFAFRVSSGGDEWEYTDDGKKTVRTIKEFDELYDVSPVTYPAYPDTSVARRSFDEFSADRVAGDPRQSGISLSLRRRRLDLITRKWRTE